MDGTLYDTKNVNYQAYSEALKLSGVDIEINYQYYCQHCNGNSYKTFLPILVPNIEPDLIEQIHSYKKNLYSKYLKYARRNVNLFSLIETIKSDYIIALVTTASKQNTNDILSVFDDQVFDFIITQEDVRRTKPNPECFLLAMKKSQVIVENTIIFEDSKTGLVAAKASGAQYVQVYGFN